jgi:hypothetical protein
VDDPVGAAERSRVQLSPGGVPSLLARRLRRASYEPYDVVAVGAQALDEGTADEAGSAGDDDTHG